MSSSCRRSLLARNATPDLLFSFAGTSAHGSSRARDSSAFPRTCAIFHAVNGREFISRVRRLGRKNNVAVRFDRTRGKGSHGTLYYGDRLTVVKDRKGHLKTGTFRGMCKQLGFDPSDL